MSFYLRACCFKCCDGLTHKYKHLCWQFLSTGRTKKKSSFCSHQTISGRVPQCRIVVRFGSSFDWNPPLDGFGCAQWRCCFTCKPVGFLQFRQDRIQRRKRKTVFFCFYFFGFFHRRFTKNVDTVDRRINHDGFIDLKQRVI